MVGFYLSLPLQIYPMFSFHVLECRSGGKTFLSDKFCPTSRVFLCHARLGQKNWTVITNACSSKITVRNHFKSSSQTRT